MKFNRDKIERAMLDWIVGVQGADITVPEQVLPHLKSTFDYLLKQGLVETNWRKDFEGAAHLMNVMRQAQG